MRKSLAIIPALAVVSTLGCKEHGCANSAPEKPTPNIVIEKSQEPPTEEEIRKTQKEIFGLLKEFIKREANVDVPPDIILHLSRTQEDYIKAGSIAKRAYGLHTVGFYTDNNIYIDAANSSELVRLNKAKDTDQMEAVPCSTMDSTAILIHELAHALTKDFKDKKNNYAYFSRTIHEALAVETEAFAPSFVRMVLPDSHVPDNCRGPAVIQVKDQRYTIEEYKGGYPNEVIFESYLFALTGKCDEEIKVNNGTWATCSLKALMHDSFTQKGAGKFLTAILKRNPKCKTDRKYSGPIDLALMTADAPHLQYALSQCDRGEKIPDVVCKNIQMVKPGEPFIMDSLTLTALYPNGQWTGWQHTFRDLRNGSVYDLDKPLRFRDGIFPIFETMPRYASTFTKPHDANQPCTIEFRQNFYCDNFQLSGFGTASKVYVLVRIDGQEYVKGSYSEGVTVNTPILEGSEVYVNVGKTHLKPDDLEVTGRDTCIISPKTD